MQKDGKKIKVLHLLCSHLKNHFGGLEVWLYNVAKQINQNRFELHFVNISVESPGLESYVSQEIHSICPNVHSLRLGLYKDRANYRTGPLLRFIRENGPFDVIHCHLETRNSWFMWLLRNTIPVRIAHFHNDHSRSLKNASYFSRPRFLHEHVNRPLLERYATHRLACSRDAGASLFGDGWELQKNNFVHFCGVDFSPFAAPPDDGVRQRYGLSSEHFVIGTVGRLAEPKNQILLVKALDRLRDRFPQVRLLVVGGEGNRAEQLRNEIKLRRLEKFAIISGPKTNDEVIKLLYHGMNLFTFPSLSEGFGIALIEAQAAGLFCIASSVCSDDVIALPSMVRRLAVVDADAETNWANEIAAAIESRPPLSKQECFDVLRDSHFSITHSIPELEKIYASTP